MHVRFFKVPLLCLTKTKICTEAHTTNSALWPVPYQCAQPYHPGSGSNEKLFRPSYDQSTWQSQGETGVHGCHRRGDMAVRMRKVLVISRNW